MKRLLIAAFVTLMFTGCATQSFDVNEAVGPMSQPELEESQAFFVGGIGQEAYINAADVCGGAENIARVEVEQTAFDIVLSWLTGSIYSPRTARVYCLS